METFTMTIQMPEHFHAEDEFANALNDDGILSDFCTAVNIAVSAWVSDYLEGVARSDVRVRVERQ